MLFGMTYVDHIIERFGGLTGLSKALGHKNPSTVQGWRERGTIPSRQQSHVLAAAADKGIEVQPADFFEILAGTAE